MISKRYNLINNLTGWAVFAVALVTYWLTLEPTASYWDCGEFIIQADKLEVGHPPGNPIFMLTARFFSNFAPSAETVSVAVNAMSGLLSALTILLLFWTITHLVRRLTVKDGQREEISLQQYLAIMGSGVVGALAYCWSDTFWFSAVEGEVYAFSSFCTALVFWLILKWENRADEPHSDRYLILIAYIIGVSVAVHLLNLLCIPAIVLVFAYRKYPGMNLVRSLMALAVSFAIIVLVLFGLVPGFIKVAQVFELMFVNGFGMSYNSGALFYVVLSSAIFLWALSELHRQKSPVMVKASFVAAVAASGMLFFGSGVWLGLVLLAALAVWLFFFAKGLSVRVLTVITWSMAVIFVGYSSYALILIRSTADTPMNQNSPDNVFDLASYLNREQYGENPLLYGETLNSGPQREYVGSRVDTLGQREDGSVVTLSTPYYNPVVKPGKALYAKGVKGAVPTSDYGFLTEGEIAGNRRLAERGGDHYVLRDHKSEMKMNPELNMLFPRIYSSQHRPYYAHWVNLNDTTPDNMVAINAVDKETGEEYPELDTQAMPIANEYTGTYSYPQRMAYKPTFAQNLAYFFNYQLNHMYLRYFMWNFAGRQNDINNQFGELDAGNWISGIPLIDNYRLGDQSLLPGDLGKDNAGHNVYYMLPLILGLLGLFWQAFAGRRGIEQFWVVFFLFFMTGIAIVLYLNQPPNQPRERDYAFAGSFYAFAIWIGLGVAALWRIMMHFVASRRKDVKAAAGSAGLSDAARAADSEGVEEEMQPSAITEEPRPLWGASRVCAAVACALGIVVPLQMVSQTWDDHDRSGRYAARDYAMNYLNSLEPNAIVFCNGDNDTFPLWYAQEVEGVRPDVKIINLSYLNSDWYANQQRMQSYTAAPVDFTARPEDVAYGKADVTVLGRGHEPADLLASIKSVYAGNGRGELGYPAFPSPVVRIPVDRNAAIRRGLVTGADTARIVDEIVIDLSQTRAYQQKRYISLGELLMLDIIATNAANGWKRPIYWASTVGDDYYMGLSPYMRSTGMTLQLVPTMQEANATRADRAYDVVTKKYRWGGADVKPGGKAPYFDETAGRMLASVRTSMVDLATECLTLGDMARDNGDKAAAAKEYRRGAEVLDLLRAKAGPATLPYTISVGMTMGQLYAELGDAGRLDDAGMRKRGLDMLEAVMRRYAPYIRYNKAMNAIFSSPSFSLEMRYVPYQYYHFIELYLKYGGSRKTVDSILKAYGLSEKELKEAYQSYFGGSQGGAAASDEEFVSTLVGYFPYVVRLQGLDASAYAAASEEERLVDSMLYSLVESYRQEGGDMSAIESDPEFRKIDMARSKRLSDEYLSRRK